MLDVALGELAPGTRHAPIAVAAGGSPVTAASWAAAGGVAALVVGRVGTDGAAAAVRAELDARGVAHRLAVDADLPTGTFVETRVGGEAAVAAHRGANARLEPADVAGLEAEALLVSGYTLLHDDTAAAGAAALAQPARWRAVDLAASALVAATGPAAVLERVAPANVLLANAEEARALTGLEPDAALRALARDVELVCVKLAGGGALASLAGEMRSAPPPETLGQARAGAGDAFAGALLAALLLGADVAAALGQACAAGAAAAGGRPATRP